MPNMPQQETRMKRHKFNIYPDAKPEDFNELVESIKANGFSKQFPITTYQGEILDGWHRWKACDQLGITPVIEKFTGSDMDAINFVLLTNRRRNLNSGQRACIAVEATEIIDAIAETVEAERRAKQAETLAATHAIKKSENEPELIKKDEAVLDKKLSETKDEHAEKTATKTAEIFGTNRTYVNQAAKVKAAPEIFEKVKSGKMTMQDANKVVRAIPTEPWLDDETERKAKVEAGQSVVANQQRDKNLIQWAEKKGLTVRIDRGSKFGNPFVLGEDGDRDQVCDSYRDHYMTHKPSIITRLPSLKGKVLICHCYPKRCHGDSLIDQ
jgi:ParB-like chromosome segregation protein Spo0J